MSSQPLKVPPLKEVAFEINFAPHLRVEDKIADFQDEIKGDFPDYAAEIALRLPTSVYPAVGPREQQPVQPVRSHSFISSDGQRIVKVSTVNLNLVVRNYLHFDDYLQSASKCLNVALQKFQIQEILRIGLRYINFVKVDQKRLGLNRFVHPVLTDQVRGRADTFFVEITEVLDNKKLTTRTGLLSSQNEGETRECVLDFDCYSDQKQTIKPTEIQQVLTDFHDTIEARFHAAVTEGYLQYMKTGQWL